MAAGCTNDTAMRMATPRMPIARLRVFSLRTSTYPSRGIPSQTLVRPAQFHSITGIVPDSSGQLCEDLRLFDSQTSTGGGSLSGIRRACPQGNSVHSGPLKSGSSKFSCGLRVTRSWRSASIPSFRGSRAHNSEGGDISIYRS